MKRLAVGLLLSVVVLGLVWGLADLSGQAAAEGVSEAFGSLSVGGLGLAFLCYGLSYLGRAWRLAVLLPGPDRLLHLASISARHNLFNLVLPLRSGEASLPLMLRRETGRSLAEGAAALVVARVLDLLSVALYLSAGLAFAGLGEEDGGADAVTRADVALRTAWIVGGLVAGLLLLRPLARWFAGRWAPDEATGGSAGTDDDAGAPADRPGPGQGGFVRKLTRFAGRTAHHLAAQPLPRLVGALVVSLLTWGLTYGACYALVVDMAGDSGSVGPELAGVTFVASLVASTFLHLTGILPINTLAGLGPWEGGWVAGYVFIGVSQAAAFASALASHAAVFAMIALLGGLALVTAGRWGSQPSPTGPDLTPGDAP